MRRGETDEARRKAELNRRLRAAFIEGAEEHSRRTHGRELTSAELDRDLRRYPRDVSER